MKWYNYKDMWIDINKCYGILLIEHMIRFVFFGNGDDYIEISYKSIAHRDAEFDKIKELMGIKSHISRCC